ncbi:MAG: hypothetical protein OXU27_03185 [Candidatus Poribacteria bacterium]|nr:hypothetical protein [Candidatus Poribacteria bacterium]
MSRSTAKIATDRAVCGDVFGFRVSVSMERERQHETETAPAPNPLSLLVNCLLSTFRCSVLPPSHQHAPNTSDFSQRQRHERQATFAVVERFDTPANTMVGGWGGKQNNLTRGTVPNGVGWWREDTDAGSWWNSLD